MQQDITMEPQRPLAMPETPPDDNRTSPLTLFRNRNFLFLWMGEAVSLLGDQFYMIALPWLVLQLTGDALAVGTVLALAGIPRALFMLVGGAISDRFSPRNVMLASNLMRLGLVGVLAMLVLTGSMQLWMLYVLSLAFGLADAFFFPAQGAIVPQLVDDDQLQAANGLTQATAQLSVLLGPVLAGGMIALLASGADTTAESPDVTGIGLAFVFDAATFLVSALTLWLIRMPEDAVRADRDESVWTAVQTSLRYVWQDTILRTLFPVIAAINLMTTGAFAVGIPVLADSRLPQGAAAFGLIMSAFGAGMLLGMLLAGVLPRPKADIMGAVLLLTISSMGLGIVAFGFVTVTWAAAVVGLLMGAANGYVTVQFITWLQLRTPEQMLGRMMSLLMFASVGLSPLSMMLAGFVIEWSLTALFVGSGVLLTLIALWAAARPEMRALPVPERPSSTTDSA